MATTTNFGWETPDDTDLVKDGAAAMRTLGNSIDTSFVDLKGGTTGQILAKASNTDLDYTWTTVAGDIEGVTAGTGLSGGGTSGTVTLTNTMATAIDAKGDLVAGTGADTFSRLAVGSNNQVLTADSATATGLKWATPSSGSMTLLSTTSLSGSSTSISVSPSGYNNLYILIDSPTVSSTTQLNMRLNNISSNSYAYIASVANGNPGFTTNGTVSVDSIYMTGNSTFLFTNSAKGKFWVNVYDPNDSSGSRYKTVNFGGSWENNSSAQCASMGSGGCNTAGAISSIQFFPVGQSWNGGTVYVYGVK